MWQYLFAAALHRERLPARFDVLLRLVIRAIPCEACRAHAMSHLRRHVPPQTMTGSASAFRYVIDFQNRVNARMGKPATTGANQRRIRASLASSGTSLVSFLERARPHECTARKGDMEIHAGNAAMRTRNTTAAIKMIRAHQ